MGSNHAGAVDHLYPIFSAFAFCAGWIQVTGIHTPGRSPARRQSRRRFRWRAGHQFIRRNIRFISLNAVDEKAYWLGLRRKFSRMRISGSSSRCRQKSPVARREYAG